jgi:hypothetical protein
MMPCIKLVDYEEYAFYNAFIQENNCKTILEIGRNGNLAKRFKENQQDYTGLEYSQVIIEKEMKTAHLGICGISILKTSGLLSRRVPRVT